MQRFCFGFIVSLVMGCALASTSSVSAVQMVKEVKEVFSSTQKDTIEKIVSSYIKNHPEELLASLQLAQEKEEMNKKVQAQEYLDNNIQEILKLSAAYTTVAKQEWPVSTIFFIDYHCSFCHRIFKDITKNDLKSNIAFVQLPILGPMSMRAASIALSARPDQFKDVNKDLFSNTDFTKESVLTEIIKKYKIQVKADKDLSEQIKKNYVLSQNIGIQGVPAVIVTNGKESKLFLGYVDMAQIADAIQVLSGDNLSLDKDVLVPQPQGGVLADPKKVA